MVSSWEIVNKKFAKFLPTFLTSRCGMSGKLGRGKVFNNIDTEFRSVAVVGVGREGAGFNELEMIDEGMVSDNNFVIFQI